MPVIEKLVRFCIHYWWPTMFINTVALGFGVSLLAFSSFTVYFTLGVLTALTIVLALVVTFILIPAVITIGQKAE